MGHANSEAAFDDKMKSIMPLLGEYDNFDLVIGLPFYNEIEKVPALLQVVDKVLFNWIGRRQLIVCAGDYSADEILQSIQTLELKHPHIEFLLPPEASGRGSSIRSFLEIAKSLEADLLVLSTSMETEPGGEGGANWLESLLTPIQGTYDMVLGSLPNYAAMDDLAHHFTLPILEAFYGCRAGIPPGGIYAIAHDFIEELAGEAKFWASTINGYGVDFWMLTRALTWNKQICEVRLGGVNKYQDLERRNQIFNEVAQSVFESLRRDSAIWMRERLLIKVVDTISRGVDLSSNLPDYHRAEMVDYFRLIASRYRDIIIESLPAEPGKVLLQIADSGSLDLNINEDLWVASIAGIMLNYIFGPEYQQEDSLQALSCIYNGRLASYAGEMDRFTGLIKSFPHQEQNDLRHGKISTLRHHLVQEFKLQKNELQHTWLNHWEQTKPPIVPLGYMEYVPGRPVVLPKKIVGKDKRITQTDAVFKKLRQEYEERFNRFINQGLGIQVDADPCMITAAVENFMVQVENTLEELLPGDLYSKDGINKFLAALFELLPAQRIFSVNTETLREMIMRFPPINLMVPLGCYKPADLIAQMDVRDAASYANLVENWSYSDRDLNWITDQLKPASFEWVDIKPLVISDDLPFGTTAHNRITNLNRITARLTVRPLKAGKGGKFPKLLYFLSAVRRLGVAEQFSRIIRQNVKERKNIGLKTRNVLAGTRQGDDFAASMVFENMHHRLLVKNIGLVVKRLSSLGKDEAAQLLKLIVDGYGLSQVLENGKFLTCTAWSWASYSFKGGQKIPGPLTTSIESRWFNHDFLELLYQELGYDQSEIMQTSFRMINNGRGFQNLLDTLLPARPKDVAVVIQEITDEPSHSLRRHEGNPLLEPIMESSWENKYVLNPGALRIKERVYLFYRAVGSDDVSHIGLAVTDGYKVLERLPDPIFSPTTPEEKMGCEDPRLIIIGQRIWMLYTAYDGNMAQIAAASITVGDFLARRFDQWQREGLAFKNIWDKDAILFPEKINGKYILYHRIEPSMWITYMNEVEFPCREQHAIIIGPRPGRMWDSLKIGAGAQPLKTTYGWLLIYHGVDYNYVYRLGVILVDLNDPQKVIYRSPNPILEPEEDYEVGLSGAWVPNVVFTCGAVAGSDKEVLEDEDQILVYYGAADTSIGMAYATLADLIPEKFRHPNHAP